MSNLKADVTKVETGLLAFFSRYWYWLVLLAFLAGASFGHFV